MIDPRPSPRILGLDPSFAATGWAVGTADGTPPVSGVFKPCRGGAPQALAAFWDQLGALHARYRFSVCFYEFNEVIFGKAGKWSRTNKSEGSRFRIQAAIELAGHLCRFQTVSVPESAWRKSFLGVARAPKWGLSAEGSGRHWLKGRAMDECQHMGWPVRSNDEAEARGVMVYGLSQISAEYAARMAGPLTRYPHREAHG